MHLRASTASRGLTLVTDSCTSPTRPQTSGEMSLGENRLIVPLTDSPDRTGAPNDHSSATRSAAKSSSSSKAPAGSTRAGVRPADTSTDRRSLLWSPSRENGTSHYFPWGPLGSHCGGTVLHTQRALPGTSGRPYPAGLLRSGCNSVVQHRGAEVRGCPRRRQAESEVVP